LDYCVAEICWQRYQVYTGLDYRHYPSLAHASPVYSQDYGPKFPTLLQFNTRSRSIIRFPVPATSALECRERKRAGFCTYIVHACVANPRSLIQHVIGAGELTLRIPYYIFRPCSPFPPFYCLLPAMSTFSISLIFMSTLYPTSTTLLPFPDRPTAKTTD